MFMSLMASQGASHDIVMCESFYQRGVSRLSLDLMEEEIPIINDINESQPVLGWGGSPSKGYKHEDQATPLPFPPLSVECLYSFTKWREAL